MEQTFNIIEQAFNNSVIPTCITDKNGYLTTANHSLYNFFGIQDKELFKAFNFFIDLQFPFYIYQEIKSGKPATFESILDFQPIKEKYNCNIENKLHVYIDISPIHNNETIEGYTLHIRAITDNYLKKLMNRRLFFFFDHTFKNLPIGIVAFSTEGKILDTNQFIENLFECSKKSLIESHFFNCCFLGTKESAEEIFKTLFVEKKNIFNKKIHCKKTNGKEIYIKINSAPIYDYNKELLYFFLLIEDITEWKTLDNSKKIVRTKIKELKEHLENMHEILNLNQSEDKKDENKSFSFTKREVEIVELISQGYANKEIAFKLKLSEATIKKNIFNIFKKTKTQNRLSLINYLKNTSYF